MSDVKLVRTNLSLPVEVDDKLKQGAKLLGITKTAYMKMILSGILNVVDHIEKETGLPLQSQK